jgi:hypothetical protein
MRISEHLCSLSGQRPASVLHPAMATYAHAIRASLPPEQRHDARARAAAALDPQLALGHARQSYMVRLCRLPAHCSVGLHAVAADQPSLYTVTAAEPTLYLRVTKPALDLAVGAHVAAVLEHKVAMLRRVPLLRTLGEEALAQLAAVVRVRRVHDGTVLAQQGAHAHTPCTHRAPVACAPPGAADADTTAPPPGLAPLSAPPVAWARLPLPADDHASHHGGPAPREGPLARCLRHAPYPYAEERAHDADAMWGWVAGAGAEEGTSLPLPVPAGADSEDVQCRVVGGDLDGSTDIGGILANAVSRSAPSLGLPASSSAASLSSSAAPSAAAALQRYLAAALDQLRLRGARGAGGPGRSVPGAGGSLHGVVQVNRRGSVVFVEDHAQPAHAGPHSASFASLALPPPVLSASPSAASADSHVSLAPPPPPSALPWPTLTADTPLPQGVLLAPPGTLQAVVRVGGAGAGGAWLPYSFLAEQGALGVEALLLAILPHAVNYWNNDSLRRVVPYRRLVALLRHPARLARLLRGDAPGEERAEDAGAGGGGMDLREHLLFLSVAAVVHKAAKAVRALRRRAAKGKLDPRVAAIVHDEDIAAPDPCLAPLPARTSSLYRDLGALARLPVAHHQRLHRPRFAALRASLVGDVLRRPGRRVASVVARAARYTHVAAPHSQAAPASSSEQLLAPPREATGTPADASSSLPAPAPVLLLSDWDWLLHVPAAVSAALLEHALACPSARTLALAREEDRHWRAYTQGLAETLTRRSSATRAMSHLRRPALVPPALPAYPAVDAAGDPAPDPATVAETVMLRRRCRLHPLNADMGVHVYGGRRAQGQTGPQRDAAADTLLDTE